MFFPVNGLAGPVLVTGKACPFFGGQNAVTFQPLFPLFNTCLLCLQAARLSGGQATAGYSLINSLFLVDLALIDPGRISWIGQGGAG